MPEFLKSNHIIFFFCIKHALTATLAKISLYKKRRSHTVSKKTGCEQKVKKEVFWLMQKEEQYLS